MCGFAGFTGYLENGHRNDLSGAQSGARNDHRREHLAGPRAEKGQVRRLRQDAEGHAGAARQAGYAVQGKSEDVRAVHRRPPAGRDRKGNLVQRIGHHHG